MTVFGRLDILYPDGRTESHPLEGDLVTVGSAERNSILLADMAVSADHFRLDISGGGISITDLDSENGTFVAGSRLQAEVPQRLQMVEQIQIGSLKLTYYQSSDSPTVAMPALDDQTQPSASGIRASLDKGEYALFPASSTTIPITVTNLSGEDAEVRVETSGLPDDWVKPARLVFPLPADETTQIQFLVKPARRADMSPGDYPLTIVITRIGIPEQLVHLVAIIKLGGFGGLSLALDPTLCPDRESFSLYLLNQGNEPLGLSLRSVDPGALLELELAQGTVEIPPGGRTQVNGHVRARRRPLVGKALEIPFALIAQAEQPNSYSVALPARVMVTPYLSTRAAFMLVAMIAAIALLFAVVIIQPSEPTISSFNLSESRVAQGTPVQLSWSATDAKRYVIEVDRAPIAELAGDSSTFTLDTQDYSDPVDIALIALSGNLSGIERRQLEIYEPVTINRFESDKTSMLRKVTGALTVRWDVDGAVTLEFTRPLGFETVSESRNSNSQGEFVLRGAPSTEFEIKLTAEDETGKTYQASIQLAIREPECTPIHDAPLYAGPDKRFPQITLAVENVPVLVRGTVESGEWLQVERASGQNGWGFHSSFFCQGFDMAALDVLTDLPQLPTATATPPPSATPTLTATPTFTATTQPTLTALATDDSDT